jgi:hypothetical protein
LSLTVDITKTTGLAFLGMMQTSSPVDGYVTFITTKPGGALCETDELSQDYKQRGIRNVNIPIEPPAEMEQ